jgi:hypothetical protein
MTQETSLRSHLEFSSADFLRDPHEAGQINPGRLGKRVADYIAAALPARGFSVRSVDFEDWGARIEIDDPELPMWIGCGSYEELENGFVCYIEPHTQALRRWFKVSETRPQVEALATALESILSSSGKVTQLRWWDDSEIQ